MWQNMEQTFVHDQQKPNIMPTPTMSPWSLHTMPWELASTNQQTGSVMHFQAQSEPKPPLHQKRKSDLVAESPPKQFITEEKITAHFNCMHISSNYVASEQTATDPAATTSKGAGSNWTYEDYQNTAKELEEKLKRASRITVCDEVKRCIDDEQRKMTLLPDRLINRIEEPCKALVLWQPPLISLIGNKEDGADEEPKDVMELENEPAVGVANPQEVEIEDFDNNNSCLMDFNNPDGMEEDL